MTYLFFKYKRPQAVASGKVFIPKEEFKLLMIDPDFRDWKVERVQGEYDDEQVDKMLQSSKNYKATKVITERKELLARNGQTENL